MLEIIIDAIAKKQVLVFTYDGFHRTVEPHAVGISRTGQQALRCFQTAGGHVKPGHEWDFVLLSKITNLRLSGDTFSAPRPGYKKRDSHMTTIHAEI